MTIWYRARTASSFRFALGAHGGEIERSGFSDVVCRELSIDAPAPDLTEWEQMSLTINSSYAHRIKIGLVGKYVQLHDAYLSVAEALRHAGYATDAHVTIRWIDSETLTAENIAETLQGVSGILIPGGFGDRGVEGMILAAQFARENKIPYLGICLGMQTAVIEFARNVCGLSAASSGELDPESPDKVIDFLPGQNDEVDKGGTLRLGADPCAVQPGTLPGQTPLLTQMHYE